MRSLERGRQAETLEDVSSVAIVVISVSVSTLFVTYNHATSSKVHKLNREIKACNIMYNAASPIQSDA